MKKAFIVHGVYGSPDENWLPWLKKELEKKGWKVFIPQFPTPEGHNLFNWLKVWKQYQEYMNEDSIVIGHSMGASFLLSVLEKLEKPIKAALFVAGFANLLGVDKEIDELNKTFLDKRFDWERIRNNCQKFYIFQSDNDPYVAWGKAKELADNLGVEMILVKGAGHFNKVAGYTKFDLLLDKIEKLNLN